MAENMTEKSDRITVAVVYATFPNETEALVVAEALVERGLVACANIQPAIRSVFIWDGKLQREQESAILMKTRRELAAEVVKEIKLRHSYENPAIVVLDVVDGSAPFLTWLGEQTAAAACRVAN